MSDPNDLTVTGEEAGLPLYSRRLSTAISYAAKAHRRHRRKGTESRSPGTEEFADGVPYLGHLLEVAAVVLEAGGDEDTAIAAVLHDVVEDQGGVERAEEVRELFGGRVADIVLSCSDSTDAATKASDYWFDRKLHHVMQAARSADESFLLVLAADKLSNCRALTTDVQLAKAEGAPLEVFRIFRPFADAAGTGGTPRTPPRATDPFFHVVGGRHPSTRTVALTYSAMSTLWYYSSMLAALQYRADELESAPLTRLVAQLMLAVGVLESYLLQVGIDIDAVRTAAGVTPRRRWSRLRRSPRNYR